MRKHETEEATKLLLQCEATAVELGKESNGGDGHRFDKPIRAELAVTYERKKAGHGGLQTIDAHRGVSKLAVFVDDAVRRVVGGDAVDRPICERCDHEFPIFFRTERGVDLTVRVVPEKSGIGHQ